MRARVASLQEELDLERAAHGATRAWADELFELYNNAPSGYHALDENGTYVSVNDTELSWLGYTRDEVVGKFKFSDLCTPDSVLLFREVYPRFKREGRVHGLEFEVIRKDGSVMQISLSSVAIRDADGRFLRSRTIVSDVTDRKRTEEVHRRAEIQEKTIRAQTEALAELSCPLLTVASGMLVMPLIGTMDRLRATQVLETALRGAQGSRAQVVIIDITGMKHVDSGVAGALLSTATALRLVGAEAVLTGIRPEIAQTLVALGVELRSIVTCGTLQSGISFALGKTGESRLLRATTDTRRRGRARSS